MSEISDWIQISPYLYRGISKEIDWLSQYPEHITDAKIEDLKKAVEIYTERCVLSARYLREKLEKLIEKR